MAFGAGGENANAFIGTRGFFFMNRPNPLDNSDNIAYYAWWIFQFAFAGTAVTIVSGAVAERCQLRAYVINSALMIAFVQPVVVHWAWSSEGWLSPFAAGFHGGKPFIRGTNGMIDFAGSGVVHMVGGMSALVGTALLGPRNGRFDFNKRIVPLHSQSPLFSSIGVLFLWFGFYGFNMGKAILFWLIRSPWLVHCEATLRLGAGSTGSLVRNGGVAARVAVTTTLSGTMSGVSALALSTWRNKSMSVLPMINGLLAGLVAICSGTSTMPPWAAIVTGIVNGPVMVFSSEILLRGYRVDVPVDAVPVHYFAGLWGLTATGLFAELDGLRSSYEVFNPESRGLLVGGDGSLLGVNLLGAVAITLWVLFWSYGVFAFLRRIHWLRIPEEEESTGMDVVQRLGTFAA